MFTPAFWNGWNMPIWLFFILQVTPHLEYFIALASQPCTIWTFNLGIRSVLEGNFIYQCIKRLWRGFRSGHKFFPIVPARSGLSILSNICGDICSSHRVFDRLTTCLAALIIPKFLILLGFIQSYRKDCSATVSDVTRSTLPALFFTCIVTEKILTG